MHGVVETRSTQATALSARWALCLTILASVYGFAVYKHHTSALKYLSLLLGLLATAWALWCLRRQGKALLTLPFLTVMAFLGFVLLRVALTPEPWRGLSWGVFNDGCLMSMLAAPLFMLSLERKPLDARYVVLGIALGTFVVLRDQLGHIWGDYLKTHELLGSPTFYRHYGLRELLMVPFLMASTILLPKRWQWITLPGVVLVAVMLAVTGFRGGWLAFGVSALVLAHLLKAWKHAGRMLLLLIPLLLVFIYYKGDYLMFKLESGLTTSYRSTGTWAPAWDMIQFHPWWGFGGWGHKAVNAWLQTLLPQHLNLFVGAGKIWGTQFNDPHNTYLAIWLHTGIIGLLLYLACLFAMVRTSWRVAKTTTEPAIKALAAATCATVLGYFVALGFLETLNLIMLGVMGGLAAALARHQQRQVQA